MTTARLGRSRGVNAQRPFGLTRALTGSLTALTLGGCVAAAELPTPQDPEALCADSLAPGEVAVVADGFDAGTRGVVFSPSGRLFVSTADTIEEVETSGAHAPVAQVAEVAGLAWWNGALTAISRDIGDGAGAVVHVDPDTSETSTFVQPLPGAESAASTPWRSLVVASPVADQEIVEVSPSGGLDGFIQQVPAPFGVAFSPDASAVWVTSSGLEPSLLRFPLDGEEPMQAAEVTSWPLGAGPSEVVVATLDGAVYAALAGEGRVVRLDPETGEFTDLLRGVDGVTGLTFGTGPWDPCALYVTSPSSGELIAVGATR